MRLASILVTALVLIAAVNAIDAMPVGVFYDDAMYVTLGKSLSAGTGYRYLNLPGNPAATHFPPGYPLLLALLWRVAPTFPANVALFKMVNAVLLAVVTFEAYRFALTRLRMDWRLAAAGALAAGLSIPMLVLSSGVMSEMFFLALLLPFLPRAERVTMHDGLTRAAVLGVGAALLAYVRTHAVALVPAIALMYVLRGRRREAGVACAAAVFVLLPWIFWVRAHDAAIPAPLRGSYGSYIAWLVDGVRDNGPGLLVSAAWQNVVTTYAIFARSFSLARNAVLDVAAVLSLLFLGIAGARAWARESPLTLAFLGFYALIVLVWPFSPLRFVWGVWPLLILLLVSGTRAVMGVADGGRGARALKLAGIVALTMALAGATLFTVRGYVNAWWATVARSVAPRIQPQLQWTAGHAGIGDVVASEDEGAVFLYTGRRAVPVSTFTARQFLASRSTDENAANLDAVLRRYSPRYVIARAVPTLEAARRLSGGGRRLVAVDSIGETRVFEVVQLRP